MSARENEHNLSCCSQRGIRNIRNVKLKFYFSPEMPLYFLVFITAVCFLDGQTWNKNSYLAAITPIKLYQERAFGLWVQKERNETWNENDLNCKNTKIKWRNDSSLPHSLLSAKDTRLLRLRPFPCLPLPLPPLPRQRTDWVKVKGGVTVRSSPLPRRSATSCFAVSYFYSVDLFCKTLFPLSDI